MNLIHDLCSSPKELNLAIQRDLLTEGDANEIIEKCSLWVLDTNFTEIIGKRLRPLLLEILGQSKSLVGNPENVNSFDIKAHSAFCVCLSKFIFFSDDIKRFIENYFKWAPPPYLALVEDNGSIFIRKKAKTSYEVPSVTELEILEATLVFLRHPDLIQSNVWLCSGLVRYLDHKDKKVRWLICNILALLCKMSEYQLKMFIDKFSTREFHMQMNEFYDVKDKCSLKYKETKLSVQNLATTSRIGKVLLPLHNKGRVNLDDGLISLPSTEENLDSIALAISSNRPVLVEGIVGGGKTYFIQHLASSVGRCFAPEFTKVQLSDQTDSKALVGTYICTPTPGEFVWKAGSLTQAVMQGHWLMLEDIDFAPKDVISLLIPLLESRMVPIPGHGNVRAHPNFQLFTTRRILPPGCQMRIGSAHLIEKLWTKVCLRNLTSKEIRELITIKWPELSSVADKLVEVFEVLSYGQHNKMQVFEGCLQCVSLDLTMSKASGRFVSLRDLMKWCSRMASHIQEIDLHLRAFQEALDCFCAAVPDVEKRYSFALHIGSHLNMNEPTVNHYFYKYRPPIEIQRGFICVGSRGRLTRKKKKFMSLGGSGKLLFSKTRLSSCLLEKVTVAVMNQEPVLIVGETGTGKTTTVQYLAHQTNHVLRVINMNQQSDSSDLLGGFKPIEKAIIISPLRQEFENLFSRTFSIKENTRYLTYIMNMFESQDWDNLFILLEHASHEAVKRLNSNAKEKEKKHLLRRWTDFDFKLRSMKDQMKKCDSALAFSFIEGTLVKAVQNGEWVLLDEINLATADTLECLSGLLESSKGTIMLHERGDGEMIKRHQEFQLFACMNPATDVGKKELPAGLRNRFTEFFMEEFQDKEDLIQLVHDYLQEFNLAAKQVEGVVNFYLKVRELSKTILTDGTGHQPHFSLRTLCRALAVARKNPCKIFQRSLFEAFCLSFLTQLDRSSYPLVISLINDKICCKNNISRQAGPIPCPGDEGEFVKVQSYWIPKGDLTPQNPKKYIITPTVRRNLEDVARIVSLGRFPILLQGDTSVGKTSLISYLAQRTGNVCVRINNHQHTDLQEYIGSYASDESGKLIFKEGILVKAMKCGHWVILDELNLAPTDVLEALNRLLDDNRELFIPEIEATIKAHPRFMLFATQNPPGSYGGRQALSRAFRNRFVELHFDLIPSEELQTILHIRCDIADSHCKKMINVLKELYDMRISDISQGKQSFITLRDLFRWAERYRLAPEPPNKYYDWDQHIVEEGYLVLAGRMRSEREVGVIKKVLEKHLKRKVESHKLFDLSEETSPVTRPILEKLTSVRGFEHVVWTQDMRRLFVLLSKALIFCEPVLLVGETGCGKTTACQMIAALKQQQLFTVNCHMHTEGADFLGGLRPVRCRLSENDCRLFEWVDGPLIQSMKVGGMFLADEISLADDSVLERLNSLLEPERTLVLSEKGSVEDDRDPRHPEIVHADSDFRLVGTMNPGGDYGKKELSPALRNRLTEIWCPKVDVVRSCNDIKMIIDHNLHPSLNGDYLISDAMISFLTNFANTEIGAKCTVSIRDVLCWVSFMNLLIERNTGIDVGFIYIEGACLVLLDSLGAGETGSTILDWKGLKENLLNYLNAQAFRMTSKIEDAIPKHSFIRCDDHYFGIEPFLIPKGHVGDSKEMAFSFEAPQTYLNLKRLIRGFLLPSPMLLEGSPGVGKTSLVTALAKASNHEIVRINLSEQTDVSDLFGADLPVEGSEGGRFSWRDGPLLRALKLGSWIVLDELNLASQSVLEGLNACFDHRGSVYVPELNKTFEVKRTETKIFACQNPQYQGGARKGLPKSFLNRFIQVYIEPLSSGDLEFILQNAFSSIPASVLSLMVCFNKELTYEVLELHLWGKMGAPWEFNLRDLFRWCEIMMKHQTIDRLNPGEFIGLIYVDRMRNAEDKQRVIDKYEDIFGNEFPIYKKSGKFFIDDRTVQIGHAVIKRKLEGYEKSFRTDLFVLHKQTHYLESLINCINMNWMAILLGPSGECKTSLVHLLADLTGRRLETLSVNSQMDVTELLGGFEQADYGCQIGEVIESLESIIMKEVRLCLLREELPVLENILEMWKKVIECRDSKQEKEMCDVVHYSKVCHSVLQFINVIQKRKLETELDSIKESVESLLKKMVRIGAVSGGGAFEWVDSPLVKAVRDGHWILIDGVNLCSPSVLDRLNGLLEPNGVLTISERGVIGEEVPTIHPHPEFRIFLTMSPQDGEISRAMRNRGVEICVSDIWDNDMNTCALMLSQQLTSPSLQRLLSEVHKTICLELAEYERPSISALGQAASLMRLLLHHGDAPYSALKKTLHLVYSRNFGKTTRVKNSIKATLRNFLKQVDKKTLKKDPAQISANSFFLNSSLIRNGSDFAYPCQVMSLIEYFQTKATKPAVSNWPIPPYLQLTSNSLETVVFIGLASVPLMQWVLFLNWKGSVDTHKCKKVAGMVRNVCKSPPSAFAEIEKLTNSRSLPADPRFNNFSLISHVGEEQEASSLANMALIGLWFKVGNEFKEADSKVKRKKKSLSDLNVLELSKALCKGTASGKMLYHQSLMFIYPLLETISKLITDLGNTLLKGIDICDDDAYLKLRKGLIWRNHFEAICGEVVDKKSFHVFIPRLVFHWRQLNDSLVPCLSGKFGLPKKLLKINSKLRESFHLHCSSLHDLAPVFRSYLHFPSPFTDEMASCFYLALSQVASSLNAYFGNDSINSYLVSDEGRACKVRVMTLFIQSLLSSANYKELNADLQSVKEEITSQLTKSDEDIDSFIHTIQLWPIIDLLVSKQLTMVNVRSEVSSVDNTKVLVKASQLPLHFLDSSPCVRAVALYLYMVTNCAVKNPNKWLHYVKQDAPENCVDSWDGEDNNTLSPVGNLLSYHLLIGFCQLDHEIEEVSVGKLSDRGLQLSQIRATLFVNMNSLYDSRFGYELSFREFVFSFVSDLFSSLLLALATNSKNQPEKKYLKVMKEAEVILNQGILEKEGSLLMTSMSQLRVALEESEQLREIAHLGVCAGLLQCWLLSHTEPLDPAEQREVLLAHYRQEMQMAHDTLLLFRWVEFLRYSCSDSEMHPHFSMYLNEVELINEKIDSLSRNVAFRPKPPQYNVITKEVFHFVNTLFLPSRVLQMVTALMSSSGNTLKMAIQQCEGMLMSCNNFIHNMFTSYPLYRDLIIPLLHSVCLTCESLKVLMVLCRHDDFCLSSKINLEQTVRRMLSIPQRRKCDSPLQTLNAVIKDEDHICSFLMENFADKTHANLSKSLAIRSTLYEVYNFAVAEGSISDAIFQLLTSVTRKMVGWWREQEEAKKRKEEEEASLYKYKARTVASSETEEEEIEREYRELFPDYAEEFKDLDEMDEEVEDDETEGDLPAETCKLTGDHLLEIIEAHRLLSSFVDAAWLHCDDVFQMKTISPVLFRIQQMQLLMRSVGPIVSNKADAESLGSFIVWNYAVCSSLKESVNVSLVDRPRNYYHDAYQEEAVKIKPLLHSLQVRVNELLEMWPAHPTLLMILKVIHRVLGFSVTSPLIRFVVGLETVLEKAHEWEKNAHKGVSLMAQVSPITDQILTWRKMELKAWNSCLLMITTKVSSEAVKFWPHLYETFDNSESLDITEIVKALKQFMESASIADYEKRHEMLFSFHCHLISVSKFSQISNEKSTLHKLIALTWNLYKYYAQFLLSIKDTVAKAMKPIEKQVKDFIKISRWNDINFFSVKDSVIKSRRTLHRHMRNWEKALRQPASPFLLESSTTENELNTKGEWDQSSMAIPSAFQPVMVEVEAILGASVSSLTSRLPSISQKCFKFINEILQNMQYISNIEAVDELSGHIIGTYQDLVNAANRADNVADKDERMKSMKAITHRKRESLSTLFKSLNHIGVSYTKGLSMFRDDDVDKCLSVLPLDVNRCNGDKKSLASSCLAWESCEKYYYRSVGRLSMLLKCLSQAHSDLGPETVKRVKGSSCHLLLHLRLLREALPQLSLDISEITLMMREIEKATRKLFPVSKELRGWWVRLHDVTISLSLLLSEQKLLLEAFTTEAPLVILDPLQPIPTDLEVQEAVNSLEQVHNELRSAASVINVTYRKFNDMSSCQLASEANIMELITSFETISCLSQKIFDSGQALHQASDSPLIGSLHDWLSGWDVIESEFEDWKLSLTPLEEAPYIDSEEISNFITKLLIGIEELYKRYQSGVNVQDEDDTKFLLNEGMVGSLLSDIKMLRCNEVKSFLALFISSVMEYPNSSVLTALKGTMPILNQYLSLTENVLAFAIFSFRSIGKLLSVILAIFQQLVTKGFCRPQDLLEQEGEGATTFEDSGPGLTEGDGQKDVSDRFESEDQLESALQQGQKEQEGNEEVEEEDGGIELSHDFEGIQQNLEREEQDEQDDEESDGEDELDKQMGETEKGAEKLDEKLWGDENEEDEGPEDEKKDEYGPGDEKTMEAELVAQEDNKNKKEVDNKEKKKKKELEVMEEDRRETNETNEEEEEPYDDKFRDAFGGEDQPQDGSEEEPMELPEEINLDGGERNEESEDENDLEINPEIEEKELFPEEEKELKSTNEENGESDNCDGDGNEESQEDNQNKAEEETDDARVDKTRLDEENDGSENTVEETEESMTKESKALEGAQAAEDETRLASRDKTKEIPQTALGAQPEVDEELKQEEHGAIGEETEDNEGVGESDSRTRDRSHRGQTSSLLNESQSEQTKNEENRPRRPGEVEQTKTLGEVHKEIHRGLMTKERSGHKEEMEEINEKTSTMEEKEGNADMYEHIRKADDHYDKQTVDAATRENAKLQPAPPEEDQEMVEPEGVKDSLMDEEKEEEIIEETMKKRPMDVQVGDLPKEKRRLEEMEGERGDADEDHAIETEGDVVMEMTVQRPPRNDIHTLLDDDELFASFVFSDNLAAVREHIEEVEEGDCPQGANHWYRIEGKVSPLALELCEKLRIILEPTEASKLKGDFRTGKRLNMRKVIPYIASGFRKDKIWLRRTQPNKRSYQVLLAVDDSESMARMNAGELALQSVALVAKALTLLEVGQLGVLSFGSDTKILHQMHKPFSDLTGAKIFANLKFDQKQTNYAKMLEDAVALLDGARGQGGPRKVISQLLLILSDGLAQDRVHAVKASVRAALEANVFVIFLVLDAVDKQYSFYDLQVWRDGKVESFVKTFPFPYFMVIRDLEELPDTIATALRKWFELVTSDAR